MRIPDVYNLNGIFNLTDGLKIKQNKKASSL
jgi:hypothetical protein